MHPYKKARQKQAYHLLVASVKRNIVYTPQGTIVRNIKAMQALLQRYKHEGQHPLT